ncbi:ATP-grasp fold amidoligase family protein [Sinomicrobium soli]|uniref:ATP-grasp fold amidoligase family protein n=1 Tax=Sinomicrobium sp. N-1-3-6 TaxID=2219864 RepID=UPI000DCC6A70|nr:ATP-grasp fold amidoligase family protein [Sinomicrobium sp. N-1-3-6]RAV30992.1 glycosyl transferase [Sinomicrobium sp. N-1-3-6]
MIKRKIRGVLHNPKILGVKFLRMMSPLLPGRLYLKLLFFLRLDYKLNLQNPQTFNEKLQWLKLNYRNPDLPKMVDKFDVKKYVGEVIGEKYVIPTLGVWDTFSEVNFESLPDQFVLKTTHDQGGVVICKDKNQFDIDSAKKKINRHLKKNLYHLSREWPYKNIKPRIIAEKYMVDVKAGELMDYKFFCFDGKPKLLYVASDRQNKKDGIKFDYFDLDFNLLNITQAYAHSTNEIEKPKCFSKMIKLAEILSKNLPHVRVDFYEINGSLYFGELTFFHHGGFVPFHPEEWDYKIGSYLKLPMKC